MKRLSKFYTLFVHKMHDNSGCVCLHEVFNEVDQSFHLVVIRIRILCTEVWGNKGYF